MFVAIAFNRQVQHPSSNLLRLTPTEGSPWDEFYNILHLGQRMAKVQNGLETLPKNFNRLSRVYIHERYRQADDDRRQTYGFAIASTQK